MKKHEWRKSEKAIYLSSLLPEIVDLPTMNYITIQGEGSPEEEQFSSKIAALYAVAYGIKMTLKKIEIKPKAYVDFTVYPLEGFWSLNDVAIANFKGAINKKDFVYTLMLRQPDFVSEDFFNQVLDSCVVKKPHIDFTNLKFETIAEGKCIQMLHLGSFENESATFSIMEEFAWDNNLIRPSKVHKEIYLSDFRKVSPEKLKTVLRFKVVELTN